MGQYTLADHQSCARQCHIRIESGATRVIKGKLLDSGPILVYLKRQFSIIEYYNAHFNIRCSNEDIVFDNGFDAFDAEHAESEAVPYCNVDLLDSPP
jgi:hypothetical protein